jgi:hypothetical protein
MYAVLYVVADARKVNLPEYLSWHPIISTITVLAFSFILGIAIYQLNQRDLLYSIISNVKWLRGKAEPPNIYATLLDPNYCTRAINGLWIIFTKDGIKREGYVKYVDVERENRLIYVTEIQEIDEDGQLISNHPPEYGMILDLTSLDSFEIVYAD